MHPRPKLLIAAIGVLIVLVGAAALALRLTQSSPSGNPITIDPPPRLFAVSAVAQIAGRVNDVQAQADAAVSHWFARHTGRNDAAFVAYAIATMGPPPPATTQRAELAYLHKLGASRTAAGARAAAWLELHGKKDVWKLYAKQYAPFATKLEGTRAKRLVKASYQIAKLAAATSKARYARSSPYVSDPSLHALNQAKFSGQTRYSYPSKHAVIAAAEVAVLARLDPPRAPEFRWMESEIDFSRLYAGGHFPSDVTKGALLGAMLGQYELRIGAR